MYGFLLFADHPLLMIVYLLHFRIFRENCELCSRRYHLDGAPLEKCVDFFVEDNFLFVFVFVILGATAPLSKQETRTFKHKTN